jgi:hypothetical protein
VLEDRLPVLGVQHLGVELHPGEPTVDVLERGDGRVVGARHHLEARGRLGHRVAVRHPHRLPRGRPWNRVDSTPAPPIGVPPNSAVPVRATVPPSAHGHRLEAVADPEHGDAGLEQGRVDPRGSSAYTDDGPPDSTIAFGPPGHQLVDRGGDGTTSL